MTGIKPHLFPQMLETETKRKYLDISLTSLIGRMYNCHPERTDLQVHFALYPS